MYLSKVMRFVRNTPFPGKNMFNSNQFLIEIPKTRASTIPATWVRMGRYDSPSIMINYQLHGSSSTTKVVRFHSPEIIELLQEREQHKETLHAEADMAYKEFLRDIAQYYVLFRDAVNKLAIADCLMSLATISLHGNFCKPEFLDGCSLSIVGGRHPIVEQLRSDPFVPNTIRLGGDSPRNLVISGPNVSILAYCFIREH